MNTLTQKLCFRQSVVLYSQRNSVFSAIRKFEISRATIYRWRKMYDGTLDSLAERSRRPHNHPNQHTSKELKLISDMRRRNPRSRSRRVLGKTYAARLQTFNTVSLAGIKAFDLTAR